MKILRGAFIFLVCLLCLLGCNEIDIDEDELKMLVSSGNQIVSSLERFKKATGQLPESLEHLIASDYLKAVPDTGIEGRKFRYVRFKPLENMEYRVSVGLGKPKIGASEIVELTFRSDGKYGGEGIEVHEKIEEWVIQTTYR